MPLLLALVVTAAPTHSVYRTGPADGLVVGLSAVFVFGMYTAGNRLITPTCPCDPARLNALDRTVVGNDSRAADYASDLGVGLALLGPAVLDGIDVQGSPALAEDLTVELESIAVTGALVTGLKYAAQRPLPVVYAGQAPRLTLRAEGYRSFPSGHTALTVAALSAGASTWTLRHGQRVWPWLIVAAGGVAVSAGRIAAGQHFYTDVAAGAGLGLAVGLVVPALHVRRELGGLTVVPTEGGALVAWGVRL